MNEKVKSGRVSKTQRHRLLELMKEHRHVGKGQFVHKDAKKQHNAVWESVAQELNAMGGSHKKGDQWKKSWIDWKASVKKQFGLHRAFSNRTGNLPLSQGPKEIDGLDKEILEFFSKDVVDGDGDSPEGGFEPIVEISIVDVNTDTEWLDDCELEAVEDDGEQQTPSTPVPKKEPKSRGHTSHSCLEELKKMSEENHAEVMGAFSKIILLLETQNATLAAMLNKMN